MKKEHLLDVIVQNKLNLSLIIFLGNPGGRGGLLSWKSRVLLEAGSRVPAPVYFEQSARLLKLRN